MIRKKLSHALYCAASLVIITACLLADGLAEFHYGLAALACMIGAACVMVLLGRASEERRS